MVERGGREDSPGRPNTVAINENLEKQKALQKEWEANNPTPAPAPTSGGRVDRPAGKGQTAKEVEVSLIVKKRADALYGYYMGERNYKILIESLNKLDTNVSNLVNAYTGSVKSINNVKAEGISFLANEDVMAEKMQRSMIKVSKFFKTHNLENMSPDDLVLFSDILEQINMLVSSRSWILPANSKLGNPLMIINRSMSIRDVGFLRDKADAFAACGMTTLGDIRDNSGNSKSDSVQNLRKITGYDTTQTSRIMDSILVLEQSPQLPTSVNVNATVGTALRNKWIYSVARMRLLLRPAITKVMAIKVLKDYLGISLVDAKSLVDALEKAKVRSW